MGVEYERWLVAKGNFFSPSGAAVVKLVERLRKEKWIVDPTSPDLAKLRFGKLEERARATGGYAVKTVENQFGTDIVAKLAASTEAVPVSITAEWLDDPVREELRLVWPVSTASPGPLRYPLSRTPTSDREYSLEVHRSPEYVYPLSDAIEPLDTTCNCGEDLEFEWDEEELVPAFRACNGIFTECEECSRTFDPSKRSAAIKNPFDGTTEEVFGGAAYRFALKVACGKDFEPDPRLAFAPELVDLVEAEFGRSFYQFGSTY